MAKFLDRHIGPREDQFSLMLKKIGVSSLDKLIEETVPDTIRLKEKLNLPEALSEEDAISLLSSYVKQNKVYKSFIGQGYYNCFVPTVIQRNILENPCWYTQYTPYQAEISQGRLEALLNYQTMIVELTGMELANSSLLDEGTAVAEAMAMILRVHPSASNPVFAYHSGLHPQSIEVLETRAEPLGVKLVEVSSVDELSRLENVTGVIVQTPTTDGLLLDLGEWIAESKKHKALSVVATDLLACCLLKPPGEYGADIVVGNSQRFGVPLGFGGPHAAFFATKKEHQREIPGRLVGISKDSHGNVAYRLALQTREQHIKRERATSNICTAQVLLAIMAGMYGVYHGPTGLKKIADNVNTKALVLATLLKKNGVSLKSDQFFDTVRTTSLADVKTVKDRSISKEMNLRYYSDNSVSVSIDETTSAEDILNLTFVISGHTASLNQYDSVVDEINSSQAKLNTRNTPVLSHPIFTACHSETQMLRYINKLQNRDLSLAHSMIPLGSCTMKLNATSEMVPVSWPEINSIHPFVPHDQVSGYLKMCKDLEEYIGEITGLPGVSLQPNAGSQGEYAGLMVIRSYFKAIGDTGRDICLIPASAHGTNPASASMAGMKVVVVKCDEIGNVDLADLKLKLDEHGKKVACLMITYPSTHGVFESKVKEITAQVHSTGAKVYMDGANLNAQVGLCKASTFGIDVCHLNLHKTFCIPHGGGGPGMGPIACTQELKEHLPGHKVFGLEGSGAVSSSPFGSTSILPISWMYIRMMGPDGLRRATEVAILNANYIVACLEPQYEVLYKGETGRVAHECILDLRHLKKTIGIDVTDIAKRLMDYGFHAPTVSFPVVETLMVEPTESEDLEELDRFCEALLSIKSEIDKVARGDVKVQESVLRNAPHTVDDISATEWNRSYTREEAVFPKKWVKEKKFWPAVGRIDNAYGDRNLFCVCAPMDSYSN